MASSDSAQTSKGGFNTENPQDFSAASLESNGTIDIVKAEEVITDGPAAHLPAHLATLALHADDSINVVSDVAPPLHVSTTFRYASDPSVLVPAADRTEPLTPTSHVYSRLTAPNSTRLEAILSTLLKAPCLTYSSGLSAFYAILTYLVPRTISIGNGYHGCHGVLNLYSRLTQCRKISLDCPAEDLHAGDLVCLETPINPTGEAFNIAAYAKKAHSRGAYLLVDATFGPPPLQDPFLWGTDVVMHSATKYFGGHSDMLGGVLAVRDKEWLGKLIEDRLFMGSVMGSMEGFLGVRSIRTLEIRVERQSRNAAELVAFLDRVLREEKEGTDIGQAEAEKIREVLGKVMHASLQKDEMSWLEKQMPNGFGPVFSIMTKGESQARRLPSKLKFFHHATSLGGVESLIEWRTMSDDTVDRRLLRLSIGVEDVRDLKQDLVDGLVAIADEGGTNGVPNDK